MGLTIQVWLRETVDPGLAARDPPAATLCGGTGRPARWARGAVKGANDVRPIIHLRPHESDRRAALCKKSTLRPAMKKKINTDAGQF